MGDSAKQPFTITCAGRTEVLACYRGKSRETGLVEFPVLQRAGIPENGCFAQVCEYLKSNKNSILLIFLLSIDSAADSSVFFFCLGYESFYYYSEMINVTLLLKGTFCLSLNIKK